MLPFPRTLGVLPLRSARATAESAPGNHSVSGPQKHRLALVADALFQFLTERQARFQRTKRHLVHDGW